MIDPHTVIKAIDKIGQNEFNRHLERGRMGARVAMSAARIYEHGNPAARKYIEDNALMDVKFMDPEEGAGILKTLSKFQNPGGNE